MRTAGSDKRGNIRTVFLPLAIAGAVMCGPGALGDSALVEPEFTAAWSPDTCATWGAEQAEIASAGRAWRGVGKRARRRLGGGLRTPPCVQPAITGTEKADERQAMAAAVAVQAALSMRGLPYSWGGGGPEGPGYGIGHGAGTKGFDCSGLTEYAWARAGVRIGTTTYEQWRSGTRVARSEVRPGDLVFYDPNPDRPGPEHVGLVVNDTQVVNAPFTGAFVRLDSIDRTGFLGVVRPHPEQSA